MSRSRFGLVCLALLAGIAVSLGADVRAQIISGNINAYSQVLSLDTCANSVLVANVSQFSVGDRVLLIQMQGATGDISNTPNFGKLTDYAAAGMYEFANISSINGLTIYLKNKFLNKYDVTGSIQLVKVAVYTDATIQDTVRPLPWSGVEGGIVVMELSGTLTLKGGTIDATGQGFRGGDPSVNKAQPNKTDYFYSSFSHDGGIKGESIINYKYGYEAGRGAQAQGGGGGDGQNAGGGGGGNGGTGGLGGNQTSQVGTLTNGGLGAFALDYVAHKPILTMGGGGGGGQQNDGTGTSGGAGGGLVIIRAANIVVTGSGTIQADGDSALLAGVDGAGGGGGGGTIALDVGKITGTLNLTARGGKGGDNNALALKVYCFAPGGGGGGGRFYTSGVAPLAGLLTAGKAGLEVSPSVSCFGTTYGATDGTPGISQTGLQLAESSTLFTYPRAISRFDTICLGDTVMIGIDGGQNFLWTPTTGLDNPTSRTPKAVPATSTQYIATYEDYRGCKFTDTVDVKVNFRPTPILNGPFNVCGDDTIRYVLSNAPNSTYAWTVAGGDLISGQGTDTVFIHWNDTTAGDLRIDATTFGAPCTATIDQPIVIHWAKRPVVQGAGHICEGDSLTLSVPNNYLAYAWSDGDTTPTTVVKKTGNYYCLVTINGGCQMSSDTTNVLVNPLPILAITASPPMLPDSGGVDTLVVGGGFNSYLWNTGKTGDTLAVFDSGYYSVAVVDSNGCSSTAVIHIIRDLATPLVYVATDTITANPGDEVTFPLRIVASRNLIPSGDSTWVGTMSFNKTVLAPIDQTIPSVINGEQRTLTLTGVRPHDMDVGTLLPVPCRVAWGDTNETVVSVETFDFITGKKAVILRYSGLLKVNVCPAGGDRLFSQTGRLLLSQNHPNPTASFTTIDLDLLEKGQHELFISDLVGRRVRTVISGAYNPGHYSLNLDLRDLPKGNYIYVLQTPSAVLSRILTIER